jgi:hypothetical protein
MAFIAAFALVAVGVLVGARPAQAVTEAAPGAPCDADDLGRRQGWPESVKITPTITHFKGYYVTTGTTGQQVVQLVVSEVITVTVLRETTITVGFGLQVLTKVEASAHFSVTKQTATTNTETRTLTWNFNQPGYYGVYSGTSKVTGPMSALQCNRVAKPDGTWATEWIRRDTGTFTTWGRDQEGVIRCEDTVPENTIMRAAQIELGCAGAAAQAQAQAAHRAENARSAQAVAAHEADARAGEPQDARVMAVPSGYVCEPGYYRIVGRNGLVMDTDDGHNGEYIGWNGLSSSQQSQQWSVCSGPPDADGVPPSVLVGRGYGQCLQPTADDAGIDGVRMERSNCEAVPSRQKLYIYRDVPGSDKVGIQAAWKGAMLGQQSLTGGEFVRQYDGGMSDGSGTYRLVPV